MITTIPTRAGVYWVGCRRWDPLKREHLVRLDFNDHRGVQVTFPIQPWFLTRALHDGDLEWLRMATPAEAEQFRKWHIEALAER